MNKKYILIIALAILIIGIGGYYFSNKEEPIACALDAKECPDGSFVGRVPPKCEFAPCPGEFEEVPLKKILLYYYNSEKDEDETGNIKCSRDGLMAIEKEIPVSKTPIQDAIKLLLKGKENLSENEKAQGITTEYPLEDFSLSQVNFKEDGTLILSFNDPLSKTSGGSCRVGILWFQIEATAKQFSGVKQVKFLPEELFQP